MNEDMQNTEELQIRGDRAMQRIAILLILQKEIDHRLIPIIAGVLGDGRADLLDVESAEEFSIHAIAGYLITIGCKEAFISVLEKVEELHAQVTQPESI